MCPCAFLAERRGGIPHVSCIGAGGSDTWFYVSDSLEVILYYGYSVNASGSYNCLIHIPPKSQHGFQLSEVEKKRIEKY